MNPLVFFLIAAIVLFFSHSLAYAMGRRAQLRSIRGHLEHCFDKLLEAASRAPTRSDVFGVAPKKPEMRQ